MEKCDRNSVAAPKQGLQAQGEDWRLPVLELDLAPSSGQIVG